MRKISVFIIAYNEAEKIVSAINSVLWADEIVLADSFSTDETATIAADMGAKVVQIPFAGFGELRNQAVQACTHDWIFSLDADERCTPEARDEILAIIRNDPICDTYFVPRKNFFMGKWIKYSGFYPDYRQPQLFRKGALSYKTDLVHEGFLLHTNRRPGVLQNPILQIPYKDFAEIQEKIARYSRLGAQRLADAGKKAGMATAFFHAAWAFMHLYLIKRGFMDGWPGFVIALGNFEGTFYKYAKLNEKRAAWTGLESPPLRREQ